MDAEAFMRDHAAKASSGRVAEIMGDLTPEAMAQLMAVAAGGPTSPTKNDVKAVRQDGDSHVFDVTYSDDNGASITMRETVQQKDGGWKIVKLEKPS